MKRAAIFSCLALLSGCATYRGATLQPLPAADYVTVGDIHGRQLPMAAITDKEAVARLVAFVNSLPDGWGGPWLGPPAGRVYFKFYAGKKYVGNFYVGSFFFGRDDPHFHTLNATRSQIGQLGKIVGFDLWPYIDE